MACDFWNKLLNFATNFRTLQRSLECHNEKLSEIDKNCLLAFKEAVVVIWLSLVLRILRPMIKYQQEHFDFFFFPVTFSAGKSLVKI